MNPSKSWHQFLLGCCLAAVASFAVCGSVQAKQSLLQTSPEGMQLPHSKDARVVYLMPGATFDKFDRVLIQDAYVAFAKDWQRDTNRDSMGLQGQVTTHDMDRMKTAVAAEFKKIFSDALQKNGGYQVVEKATATTLILRPAILNLQVTAPDLQTTDMGTTLVRSAGQMTLYLELWDASTDKILARIMDPQADNSMGGMGRVADRASNKAAADEILRKWAEKLRKQLDAVRGKTNAS